MPDVLSELTDDLCSSIGSLKNTNKISNTLKSVKGIRASNVTISNYLEYLTEAFLFENAKRYDVKRKKYYIQSALDVSDPVKLETELRPLMKTNDFLKKIVISKTTARPWTDERGILHLGLYDFLLDSDSLEL